MKYLPLIWKSLWRRKVRTTFTLLSIFIAFLLFGILMTIRAAFSLGVDLAGLDRLILIHKISLVMPLPESYKGRLQSMPGVEIATHNSWFGGVYQDPKNFIAQIAVEPQEFMEIYKEFTLPPEQMKAWLGDRQGAIAGRDVAERFGWKVGDRIPIQATIWQPKGGGTTWEFNLVGIYDGDARRRQDAVLLPLRLPEREPRPGRGPGRLVHRQDQGPVTVAEDGADLRRDVRQLAGRDEDHDREGLHRRLRQADRRHRLDHDRDPGGGALHDPAGGRQHHGAGGARAHQRARRPQDAGLHRRRGAEPGARGVVVRGPRRRRARPVRGLADRAGRRPDRRLPAGLHPARPRHRHRRRADGRRRRSSPASCRRPAPCGSRSPTRCARRKDPIMSFFTQIFSVAWLSVRTIRQRMGSSAVAVVGIAGVVIVFVAVLSIAEGFQAAMKSAGQPDRALIMRGGASDEMSSGLDGEAVEVMKQAPGIRRDNNAPLASTELYVIVDLPKRSTMTAANVPMRGIVPATAEGALRRPHRAGAHARVRHQRDRRRARRRGDVRRAVGRLAGQDGPGDRGPSSASSSRAAACPRPSCGPMPAPSRAPSAATTASSRCSCGSSRRRSSRR